MILILYAHYLAYAFIQNRKNDSGKFWKSKQAIDFLWLEDFCEENFYSLHYAIDLAMQTVTAWKRNLTYRV